MSGAKTAPQCEASGGLDTCCGTCRVRPEVSRYEHGQPRVLTVTQSGTRPDRTPFANVSVYDRA